MSTLPTTEVAWRRHPVTRSVVPIVLVLVCSAGCDRGDPSVAAVPLESEPVSVKESEPVAATESVSEPATESVSVTVAESVSVPVTVTESVPVTATESVPVTATESVPVSASASKSASVPVSESVSKSASASKPQPPSEPPPASTPPSFVLAVELASGGPAADVPVIVEDHARGQSLRSAVEVGGVRLSLAEYCPEAMIRKSVEDVPDGQGLTLLRIDITTPGARAQSTWFVPGSRVLGRIDVLALYAECLAAVPAKRLAEVEAVLRRLHAPGPKFLVEWKATGRRLVFPATVGKVTRVPGLDYTLECERLFHTFAVDPATGKAIDRSPHALNPAVDLRVVHAGVSRRARLFSQLPGYSSGDEDELGVLRLVYPVSDHPRPRAYVSVVDAASGTFPVFVGIGGGFHRGEVRSGGSVSLAGVRIGVAERRQSARVVRELERGQGGRPAVRVTWGEGADRRSRWVLLDAKEEIRTPGGVVLARLRTPGPSSHGGRRGGF